MSDATERPAPHAEAASDAWEQACAEDLAAERARRRERYGQPPGSAAEELRKLVDAVAEKVAGFQLPLAGAAAQDVVQQVVAQAKAVVEPVIERNPQVFDHLATAGSELLAAYRAAVQGQEGRWTRGASGDGPSDSAGAPTGGPAGGPEGPRGDDGTPGGSERIDLD
ncbi:hypothetical protein AF335_00965 [Streptomyces eurocidicus]|uniref:DUF5304 domain-containing protein n=1 Tax=Streptomyces eurocidicus TaxID=66423 RepID=A0A2N8P1W7_STREU|nr:DUF5304 family protein [Streptomyces eurocidicus]MBB5118579.1 hypothetical protein [Streptomyces eurocidicus]MBF6052029.1 hypothetical protein [Streptomyces eurocidicus]PNE35015.1 hypothetical protein AF335_00965 [Streptomyces eurocidicus]